MDIRSIKGIGIKTEQLLKKLDINTTDDLINYFPRDYDEYSAPIFINELDNEKIISVKGKVISNPVIKKFKNISLLIVNCKDEQGTLFTLKWYNMNFIKTSLKLGSIYIFRGRVNSNPKNFSVILEQPEIFSISKYMEKQGELWPVYSLTKGLSNKLVTKSVRSLLENKKLFYEFLPEQIINEFKLMRYSNAMETIHFPKNRAEMEDARRRLAFNEFLMFLLGIHSLKSNEIHETNQFHIHRHPKTNEFIDSLPYELTSAQKKVINEIELDFDGAGAMNRLIQGDVGSGKTIVALIALLDCSFGGYQGALMAPTEVLATQHYENISKMFNEYGITLNIDLIVGSMTQKEKKLAYERIEQGRTDIIIGTHAIIQDKVIYKNLGLVITDEQHRFGVKQREKLTNKSRSPHILVMSATPIPRTLAIILYGDLKVSIIDELPSGRIPIKNCVVGTEYRNNSYKFMEQEVNKGRQCYVICPMIEENEESELTNVINYTETLRENLDPSVRIAFLHGKMKNSEKNLIMEEFSKNIINILVSTTVIEVGINVPNATVMMVENAERFGLASLHQLRGRVGRGKHQSYCIFVSTSKKKETRERLDILNRSNDGFEIARWDLKLRGPGDFFGIRQSGESDFKIGDIYSDSNTLMEASKAAEIIESMNPQDDPVIFQFLNNHLDTYLAEKFRLNL